jgi:hypothetical protein
VSKPQHHAEPQVLVDFEAAISVLDYDAHFRDLGPEYIQPATLAQFAVKRDVQHHPNYTPNG